MREQQGGRGNIVCATDQQRHRTHAIVGGAEDTAAAKIAVFKECGIEVAATPSDMAEALIRAAKAKGVTLS